MAASTRQTAGRSFETPFRLAFKKGRTDHWPLRGLEKPTQNSGKKVIADDDWATIIKAVKDQEFTDVLTVLWETGARPDEVRRAEARHFDRDRAALVFPWGEAKGRRKCKTNRVVYLSERALQIVERLANQYPSGNLFRNMNGDPWRGNAIVLRCSRLSEATGIKFTAYQVRHTWATRAHAAGIDQKTTAELLGHRDASMLRVYQHPADDTLRAGLRKLA